MIASQSCVKLKICILLCDSTIILSSREKVFHQQASTLIKYVNLWITLKRVVALRVEFHCCSGEGKKKRNLLWKCSALKNFWLTIIVFCEWWFENLILFRAINNKHINIKNACENNWYHCVNVYENNWYNWIPFCTVLIVVKL